MVIVDFAGHASYQITGTYTMYVTRNLKERVISEEFDQLITDLEIGSFVIHSDVIINKERPFDRKCSQPNI